MDRNNHVNILVVGAHKVGKTSLLTKFTDNSFSQEYKKTFGISVFTKTITLTD